jgi:hypothetical protein
MFVCLIAVAGMVLAPAASGGKKRKVRTTVTIEDYEPARAQRADVPIRFLGTADASKRKCERRRKVVLFKTLNGTKQKLGTAKTNRKGEWSLVVPFEVHLFKGQYTAKGTKRKTKRIVCKPDVSDAFLFA